MTLFIFLLFVLPMCESVRVTKSREKGEHQRRVRLETVANSAEHGKMDYG